MSNINADDGDLLSESTCRIALLSAYPQLPFILVVGALLLVFVQVNFELDRFFNLHKQPTDGTSWDFIVVGGGSAGAVVASRLMASSFEVLLLEAGGEQPCSSYIAGAPVGLSGSPYDWKYKTTPQNCCYTCPNGIFTVPRGKCLGGTSVINSMLYVRGSPLDYDKWAVLTGDPNWNSTNVDKALCRVEHYVGDHPKTHGCKGRLNVERARHKSLGRDIFEKFKNETVNAGIYHDRDCDQDQNLCLNFAHSTTSCGLRWSTNTAFLSDKKNSERIRIQKFSTVTRVIFDSSTIPPRAIGVEYLWHHDPSKCSEKVKVYRAYARKEVILCAGALNSPQILHNSGIGPKDELEVHGIPVIADLRCGQGLQDHVGTIMMFQLLKGCFTSFIVERDALRDALKTFNFDKKTGCLGNSFLQSVAHYGSTWNTSSVSDSPKHPDMQTTFLFNGISGLTRLLGFSDFAKEEFEAWANKAAHHPDALTVHVYVSRPWSEGSVKLSGNFENTPKPCAYTLEPQIDPKYFSNSKDIEALIQAAQNAYRVIVNSKTYGKNLNATFIGGGTKCWDKLGPGGDFDNYEYWKCYVLHYTTSVWHWCCSCRMGAPGDPKACLDSRLRVNGVQGLRVADCSSMPSIPSGNTNAPAIMVGEMASTMIFEDHKIIPIEEPICKPCTGDEKPLPITPKLV